MRPYVKLHKGGDRMGVETNASDFAAFWRLLSEEMAGLIDKGEHDGDWKCLLEGWLPASFEVAARLRGYKANVVVEQVITAGIPAWQSGGHGEDSGAAAESFREQLRAARPDMTEAEIDATCEAERAVHERVAPYNEAMRRAEAAGDRDGMVAALKGKLEVVRDLRTTEQDRK